MAKLTNKCSDYAKPFDFMHTVSPLQFTCTLDQECL